MAGIPPQATPPAPESPQLQEDTHWLVKVISTIHIPTSNSMDQPNESETKSKEDYDFNNSNFCKLKQYQCTDNYKEHWSFQQKQCMIKKYSMYFVLYTIVTTQPTPV